MFNRTAMIKVSKNLHTTSSVAIGNNGTTLSRDFIDAIDWAQPNTVIRNIIIAVFGKENLATHNLSGRQEGVDNGDKQQLDPLKVTDIIQFTTSNTDMSPSAVRRTISIYCSSLAKRDKRQRYKSQIRPLTTKDMSTIDHNETALSIDCHDAIDRPVTTKDRSVIGPYGTTVSTDFFDAIDWSKPHCAIIFNVLEAVFGKEILATHNLSGRKAGDDNPTTQRLDPLKVADIIAFLTRKINLAPQDIRQIISAKCYLQANPLRVKRPRMHLTESEIENLTTKSKTENVTTKSEIENVTAKDSLVIGAKGTTI